MNLTRIAPMLSKQGVWGPVTATLDWCEINHQFSPYIAEMANTFSNLFSIFLALGGCVDTTRSGLPSRYPLGYVGVALVGIGSFFFHATLKYEAQLADELPMIYVGSMSLWMLFDTQPGFGLHTWSTKFLIMLLALFDVVFTWSYMVYRNPVFHQVVFASIIGAIAARTTYLLQCTSRGVAIPPKARSTITSMFNKGLGLFAFGFFVWNIDNIYCRGLMDLKMFFGWPTAFFLEGHSWWHVLTGLGSYYMFIGIQYLTLCMKDSPKRFAVKKVFGIPVVRRVLIKDKFH